MKDGVEVKVTDSGNSRIKRKEELERSLTHTIHIFTTYTMKDNRET